MAPPTSEDLMPTTTSPAAEPRTIVSWTAPGQPIVLTIYGPDGEVAVAKLSPTRALVLAQQLIEPAVRSIKHSMWGPGWPG